jgi:hypothetical protein
MQITHLTFDGRHAVFEFRAHIHPVDDFCPFICGRLDRIKHCAIQDDRPHRSRSRIIFEWNSKSVGSKSGSETKPSGAETSLLISHPLTPELRLCNRQAQGVYDLYEQTWQFRRSHLKGRGQMPLSSLCFVCHGDLEEDREDRWTAFVFVIPLLPEQTRIRHEVQRNKAGF